MSDHADSEQNDRPLTDKTIGYTINTSEYQPDNHTAYAMLDTEARDYEQPGAVVEIDTEGVTDVDEERCFGIVRETVRCSDVTVLEEQLNRGMDGPEPASQTVLELEPIWSSGSVSTVPRGLPVEPADRAAIREAFSMPSDGIPIGVYTFPSGTPPEEAPAVRLDPSYVLGRQGAHLNVGGKSGWGKTSLGILSLKGITSREDDAETAIIAFNVKRDDLLWIDRQNDELTDTDRDLYERMGIEPEPFDDVRFLAPEAADRPNLPNSVRLDSTRPRSRSSGPTSLPTSDGCSSPAASSTTTWRTCCTTRNCTTPTPSTKSSGYSIRTTTVENSMGNTPTRPSSRRTGSSED